MKIWVTGIVHYPDKVVLVRDNEKQPWRLPVREVDETEDIILSIRRCVITQTGYRTAKLRFFKVQTQARTPKQGAFIKFIFGCEVSGEPVQTASLQTQAFGPDEIIKLADKQKFCDSLLIDLVARYHALVAPPEEYNPMPATNS
jgi:hypothetical protein